MASPSLDEAKEEDKKITTDQLLNNPKTLVLDKETSIRGIKFQPGDVVSVQYQFDDDNESFYRIKGYGKDEIKINHLTKKEMDNFLKNTLLKITEAKEEDKVDTITMDIPLFLRMLEYAKEDAAEDMDLHDVTEKANTLGKERGILSMDDYNEIVGAAEEIDEATDYMKRRKAMDDYTASKKDKPKKSYNPNPSGKTDYMKRRQKDLAEAILSKLKK